VHIKRALDDPDYKAYLAGAVAQLVSKVLAAGAAPDGCTIMIRATPKEFTASVKEDTRKWAALIKQLNISLQ